MRHNLCACEVFIFRFAASMILSALIDHQTYTAEKILYFQKHPFSKTSIFFKRSTFTKYPLLRYIHFLIFILTKYSLLLKIHFYKIFTSAKYLPFQKPSQNIVFLQLGFLVF